MAPTLVSENEDIFGPDKPPNDTAPTPKPLGIFPDGTKSPTIEVTLLLDEKCASPPPQILPVMDNEGDDASVVPSKKSILHASPAARKLRIRVKSEHHHSFKPGHYGPFPLHTPLSDSLAASIKFTHAHSHNNDASGFNKIPHMLARSGHIRKILPRRNMGIPGVKEIFERSSILGSSSAQIQPPKPAADVVHPTKAPEGETRSQINTDKPPLSTPTTLEQPEAKNSSSPALPAGKFNTIPTRPPTRRHRSLPAHNNLDGLHCPGRAELREKRRYSDPGPAVLRSSYFTSPTPPLTESPETGSPPPGPSDRDNEARLISKLSEQDCEPQPAESREGIGSKLELPRTRTRSVSKIHRSPSLDPVLEVDESLSIQPNWAKEFEDFINNRESEEDDDTVEDSDSDDDASAWTGSLTDLTFTPMPKNTFEFYLAYLRFPELRQGLSVRSSVSSWSSSE